MKEEEHQDGREAHTPWRFSPVALDFAAINYRASNAPNLRATRR